MQQKNRPVYLNLPYLGSKMSITGKISILHRISGILLFIALPFILGLFHKSLTNSAFYESCYLLAKTQVMKVVYIILIWAIMHHLCAGLRFIFIDNHQGVEKLTAQKSAWWVLVVSILLTIALGVYIW